MAQRPDNAMDGSQADVWSAISSLEHVLEAMPNDRTPLEILSHAYEQVGDLVKAREYLVRLAKVLLTQGDAAAAAQFVHKLEPHAEDPAVSELLAQIRGRAAAQPAKREPAADAGVADEARRAVVFRKPFDLDQELTCAWNLMQSGLISQDEYSSILQDLTEMSASGAALTISVLHVLNDRGFKNQEKLVVALAKACGTPLISPSRFEIRHEMALLLPHEFIVQRGVAVFEKVGRDLLAVVMNPYDQQVRRDLQTVTAKRCHFYLTFASEFDTLVARLAELRSEKPKA